MNTAIPDPTATICAPATPQGSGALGIIRLSGPEAFDIAGKFFFPAGKTIDQVLHPGQQVFGYFQDGDQLIDELLMSVFCKPASYTGEDIIEFSHHGSPYIQRRILECLVTGGARLAEAGEFTLRAFLNKKMDLTQAEAVADLIASSSANAHKLAIDQMRGGFAKRIEELRQKLLDFTSLIELELDFSEEDVEFADRAKLESLLTEIEDTITKLLESFRLGNVMKHGLPVAIIGKPNVGKSTLLNALLKEEKAIVSDIPGTTRDAIEDTIVIEGNTFRFIDTAGLRKSDDTIENIGMEKTWEKVRLARVVLYLFDAANTKIEELNAFLSEFEEQVQQDDKKLIFVGNKIDQLVEIPKSFKSWMDKHTLFVSAKRQQNLHLITESLLESLELPENVDATVVNNIRHFEALHHCLGSIRNVGKALDDGLSGDLLSIDLREALMHLGSITGQISTDEILGNIFGRFCIGK